ncbi:MFS transporter [Brevibacterium luteolum]|uniref:MFS transporter n=1 Tax=Brevibacterium luteolum TaxID=199591 RepID=A0A6G8KWA7_9MICO|nr:MFS transporter [Brevibacterium luteolum]QIN28901.1 MFS transporter [Brevibacterium luteolum]
MTTREPLWTGQFVLAFTINLVFSISFYVLITSMAGYAVTEFAAGSSIAGLTASAFIIGATLARIVAGKYLDFVGRRISILAALSVFVLSALAYLVADHIWVVIAIRLIHGMAFGWGSNTITAIAQSLIPQSRRSEGTGYFGTSTTLSTGLGPFLAVWLSGSYGYDAVFYMCAIVSAIGLALGLLLRPPNARSPPRNRPRSGRWPWAPSSTTAACASPRSCCSPDSPTPWCSRSCRPTRKRKASAMPPASSSWSSRS